MTGVTSTRARAATDSSFDVRLADEDGTEVDEGDPGEVWVRGPSVFRGYWPDGAGGPDADGWFRSGDVAYADDDGDLHLVDRRREVILVNGFNVYPREIELVIDDLEGVAEAAVVGVPDDATGEAVTALVVLTLGVLVVLEAFGLRGWSVPQRVGALAAVAAGGARAVRVWVVQMTAERFDVARDIDPAYDRAYRAAERATDGGALRSSSTLRFQVFSARVWPERDQHQTK